MSKTNATNNNSDPTFRDYNHIQAKQYAESRLSYSSKLYNTILRHHADTGGRFNTLLDVGCGPGNATRDLAPSFDTVMGIDPGVEMIDLARQLGGTSKTDQCIQFQVGTAEDCANVPGITAENSVDLLVSAMAVSHYYTEPIEKTNRGLANQLPKGTLVLNARILGLSKENRKPRRHSSIMDLCVTILP